MPPLRIHAGLDPTVEPQKEICEITLVCPTCREIDVYKLESKGVGQQNQSNKLMFRCSKNHKIDLYSSYHEYAVSDVVTVFSDVALLNGWWVRE